MLPLFIYDAFKRVALRHPPELLLVIKLNPDGTWTEIYNGPGDTVWKLFYGKKLPTNGQHSVGLGKLKKLMADFPQNKKIPLVPNLITP